MDPLVDLATQKPLMLVSSLLVATCLALFIRALINNVYRHPLAKFPGPLLAALTPYRKAWIECILLRSWHHELERLHSRYGPVVRVSPNELHFDSPRAYHDIYNSRNRWDKEESLYHSFGEDRSSFGFLTYKEAKERKDVLNKSFSAQAIEKASTLVQDKVDALCQAFARQHAAHETSDLSWAFRCMTMDIITYYSFGKSIDAINEPGFRAPIILAMDASLPVFIRFKHSSAYKNMIMKCPPHISRVVSPSTAGLVDLQQILGAQIEQLMRNPEEQLKLLPHNNTIYHHLLDKESYRNGTVPEAGSLYEEGQALMFAGADTVGNTLMLGTLHIAQDRDILSTLQAELRRVFPDASQPPSVRELEKLPYLNACLKEALRMTSGVISGLPRIVPAEGATIDHTYVPGGAVVSIGSTFVHYNAELFPEPFRFRPERWLADASLDNWLVPFSRGPRACLGINLAWLELRLTFACVFRRFDLALDASTPAQLTFSDNFLPCFTSPHVKAVMKPAPP